MRIDVTITYNNGQVHTHSEAAACSESRPALILLSHGADGTELVEAVGEPFDVEMQKSAWERDKGSRTYRCFDPFDLSRFDPRAAAMVVRHLCLYAQQCVKPRRGLWRVGWGWDRFQIRVSIPNYYEGVPAEQRADFERRLRSGLDRAEVSG